MVFKWLMRAFSGHLPPEQLLYLWDVIIAYDSLHVIPLLAVCILSFRRENLLQVDTLQNVEVFHIPVLVRRNELLGPLLCASPYIPSHIVLSYPLPTAFYESTYFVHRFFEFITKHGKKIWFNNFFRKNKYF